MQSYDYRNPNVTLETLRDRQAKQPRVTIKWLLAKPGRRAYIRTSSGEHFELGLVKVKYQNRYYLGKRIGGYVMWHQVDDRPEMVQVIQPVDKIVQGRQLVLKYEGGELEEFCVAELRIIG